MGHLAVCDLSDTLHRILRAGVDGVLDAEALREVETLLHEIEEDRMCTVCLCHHAGHETDRTCTDDRAVLTCLQTTTVNAVKADGQRLCHRCLLPAHALRDLDQHIRRVAVVLCHTAIDMHT